MGLLLLGSTVTAHAQGSWTVDSCMRYAIEKNLTLRNSRLDTRIAREDFTAAIGDFLPTVSTSGAFGKRMGHLLFKLSVDQNLMGNILAADIEIDPDQLRKARVRCVKEVKETNGEISFEDAVRYQQEAE